MRRFDLRSFDVKRCRLLSSNSDISEQLPTNEYRKLIPYGLAVFLEAPKHVLTLPKGATTFG
jgi:hypothetical protein